MNKIVASPEQAVADIPTAPRCHRRLRRRAPLRDRLICALRDQGTKELTLVCNSLGDAGATRGQILAENNQVKKLIAAFSVRPGTPTASEEQIANGKMEVELVPQGILVERCRAGGAGIPAFYSPTGVHTDLAKGREIAPSTARPHVLEHAIHVTTPCCAATAPTGWATCSSAAAARTSTRALPRPRASRSSRWTRSWSPASFRQS
jgi:3-oxoacid CoA-transferase